jgi:hypothetical protein
MEIISTVVSKRDKKSNETTQRRLQSGIVISVILAFTLKYYSF